MNFQSPPSTNVGLARRSQTFRGRHSSIVYGHIRIFQVPLTSSALLCRSWITLRFARRFRCEQEDIASRRIQRFVRQRHARTKGRQLLAKLQLQRFVAQRFQKTFHAVARNFFQACQTLRNASWTRRDNAARTLQRSLRSWLARCIVKRMAAQHMRATMLRRRVLERRQWQWKTHVIVQWAAHVSCENAMRESAICRIQRAFRRRRAIQAARHVMEKKARQRQFLEVTAVMRPLERSFSQWAQVFVEKARQHIVAARTFKHSSNGGGAGGGTWKGGCRALSLSGGEEREEGGMPKTDHVRRESFVLVPIDTCPYIYVCIYLISLMVLSCFLVNM
jgi:hypothetical protein